MNLEEIQNWALELPDSERAALAEELLNSLPAVLLEDDDGLDEARRRSKELDLNPSAGLTWDEVKRELGR